MKCINSKIKKGKVTFDFLHNIVSSVQANLFTQSGTIQGRPSSISDFNTFPSWSYAPIKFRWTLGHLCHMDTFSNFFYESISASQSIKELSNMYKVKPVLRGHLWDKEKVAL